MLLFFLNLDPHFVDFSKSFACISEKIITFVLKKILKYSWGLSMALGISCMFGFPGTFIISEEVAAAQSANEEEREYLLSHILPKMLVAGFTTVTIAY